MVQVQPVLSEGWAAANQMLGNPLGLDDMVGLASDIEGHPDNTTPALLGGIVTAVLEEGKVFWVKQEGAQAPLG